MNAGRAIDVSCYADTRVTHIDLGTFLSEEVANTTFFLYENYSQRLPLVKEVVLGGTFDRFHNGHKKLLMTSLEVCTERMVVGVTADSMLKEKAGASMIQGNEKRIQVVVDFLKGMKGDIKFDVVKIEDPWGPSVVRKELEAIVVSSETLKG